MRAGRSWDRLAEVAGLELIEVEGYSPEALRRALCRVRADVVFNLAAAGVGPSTGDFRRLLDDNVNVVANLIEVVAGAQVRRFIHVGSCSEFAAGEPGRLIDESWPQEPSSAYGIAKLAATHVARVQAQRYRVPLLTLRLFGVYGPGEAPHRLLPSILHAIRSGKPVELTPGLQQRDWLHVADAATALEAAARTGAPGEYGTLFNVCTGQAASVHEVGEFARRQLGAAPRLLRWGALPYRPEEPRWMVGNPARFCEATGWRPHWDWREGVQTMLERRAELLAA